MPFINEQPVQSEVNDPLEHELVLAAYKIKFSTVLSLEVTKFDLTIGFSVVDLVENNGVCTRGVRERLKRKWKTLSFKIILNSKTKRKFIRAFSLNIV